MGKFLRRLKFYAVGLGIGTIFTFMIFGNRGCSWLPDNRVKNMIAEKEILVGDSVLALMDCQNIDNTLVYALLEDGGDVDYSKSLTDVEPKEYHIEGEVESELYFVRFALKDSTVEILDAKRGNKECNVSISNDSLHTLNLPHKDVIAILESHDFRITVLARCQMEEIGISEPELLRFHKSAEIIIEESEPRLVPNPYYVLEGEFNGKKIKVKYEVGENRTRIKEFIGFPDC